MVYIAYYDRGNYVFEPVTDQELLNAFGGYMNNNMQEPVNYQEFTLSRLPVEYEAFRNNVLHMDLFGDFYLSENEDILRNFINAMLNRNVGGRKRRSLKRKKRSHKKRKISSTKRKRRT